MKKAVITIAVIVLFSTLISCKKDRKTFSNKKYAFSISFDKKWDVKENHYGAIIIAVNEESKQKTQESISIIAEKKKMPMNEYIKDYINEVKTNKELRTFMKNIKVIGTSDITLAGQKSKKILYEYTGKVYNDKLLVNVSVLEQKNEYLLITGVYNEKIKAVFEKELKKAIASFKIK